MPRKARLLVPNCPHHIVQRGHNRNVVFLTDDDCQFYLENLREFKQQYAIKIYAYCLMTNHIHLLAEPPDDVATLSLMMKRLAGRQTAYTNKLEKRSGTLWGGRYKASPVDRDSYLLVCARYIELNPVKAMMVSRPEDYRWSSYRNRIGIESLPWLDRDPLYETFSCEQYRQFIASGVSKADQVLIAEALQRNQLTGGRRFIEEIEKRIGRRIEPKGRGRPHGQN